MKSFVYHKLVHSFHQGPLNKHKVVKTVDAMVWNIKLKCKCGSVLISSPPWPNITPAKQVACTRSVVFLHSDWQRAEDPEERSQSKMWMMTLDFLWWTRLRWILRVCRGRLWGEWGRTGWYEQAADQLHTIVPLVTSCAEMFEQLLVNLLWRQTNRHN